MTTFVFYDPATGRPKSSIRMDTDDDPFAEPHIVVADNIIDHPLDEYEIINGELVLVNLDHERKSAADKIDQKIDSARRLFITDIAGQDMVYLRKEAEAREFIVTPVGTIAAGDFPFIEAESDELGEDMAVTAARIVARADAWTALAIEFEKVRVSSKDQITNAADTAAMSAIVDTAFAQVDAIVANVTTMP